MCIDASDGIARGERDGDLVDSVYAKRSRFNQLLGREFPISFGKSGTGFGGQWRFGVFRGGGGVASLVPTREIEAAASNDFESTRLVGRVIQFEYVCVAPKIRPCFADDSHRRSRNRSSRPDLHPARQFFFAADPSDSSLYHPSPPLKREGLHGSITMVRRGRRGGRTLGPALNLCKCMPAIF